ncbi:hypothetical protein [Priestia megaterium]|uniref:hypothetical protein n=1 Tax=Priestia megaterium TaxID=1404 RepID=UPI002877D86F|nr:hypothetical protein [Priestia megaterium]
MSYENYGTTYQTINGGYICMYCGNTDLVIDDSFDEHGNYGGTRYYCTCDQAKIEQKMKKELEIYENKRIEIEEKYADKLEYNKSALAVANLTESLGELVQNYISYSDLGAMTKEKFLKLAEEAYIMNTYDEE